MGGGLGDVMGGGVAALAFETVGHLRTRRQDVAYTYLN